MKSVAASSLLPSRPPSWAPSFPSGSADDWAVAGAAGGEGGGGEDGGGGGSGGGGGRAMLGGRGGGGGRDPGMGYC